MSKSEKSVSIISPCYNGAKYLPSYLDSVLNQTYNNIELLFVDDASTDNTLKIIDAYKGRFANRGYKLRIFSLEKNSGQAAAINRALTEYNGEYVEWMDSDDIFLPDAIEKKVNFLEQNPDCGFALNKGFVVNEDNLDEVVGVLGRNKPDGEDRLFDDYLFERNVAFCPGIVIVRSTALKKAIPTSHIFESREGQNWQFYLPLSYCFKHGYIEEPLFKYVVHSDSHSHAKMTFERQIEKYENYDILLKETVRNIPGISQKELLELEKRITEKTRQRKLSAYSEYEKRSR